MLAYCEVVAGRGERAAAAAAEAFGSFRVAVVQTSDLATLNPEALLVSATRHAAARHASTEVPAGCAPVPRLLAARADRSIGVADEQWLDEHLESCWTCRAPVARFNFADKAYAEPPHTPLDPAVKAAMVAAMIAAAPRRAATADVPAVTDEGASGDTTPASAGYPAPARQEDARLAPQPPALNDLPPLDDHATPADPPTSMPAGDRAEGEPSAAARRARRKPGGRRSLKQGTGEAGPIKSPALRRTGTRGARWPARRRRPPRDAAAAAAAAAVSAGAVYRAADADPAAAATGSESAGAGGRSLPRPRRQISGPPARRGRRRGSLRAAIVLPAALVVVAIFAALAVAGVFGGGEPASIPQSFSPDSSDTPTNTQPAPVVVVPGAAAARAAEVEKSKARARAARSEKKKKAAAKLKAAARKSTSDASATAPPPPPPPAAGPAPAPAPPPAASAPNSSSGGGKPKIDAGSGATGAEQLPPAKDTSNVPELAPPVQPVAPPPG